MTLYRRNPKRDANEAGIIRDLKKCGCSVQQLSGKDIPDLLVGFKGENYLLEVKSKGGKAQQNQIDWACEWRGKKPRLVRTTEEALIALGIVKPLFN
jgi:Holliday junction resolvase